jgi:hypothetical protein
MASAGVAVGAIMAISPVFAQGTTTPTSPGTGDTLLAAILAAATEAGITLTPEQTKAIAEVVTEITQQSTQDVEDEDEDDDDDTADVAAAATTTKQDETKHTVTVTFTAPQSTEEKGDD